MTNDEQWEDNFTLNNPYVHVHECGVTVPNPTLSIRLSPVTIAIFRSLLFSPNICFKAAAHPSGFIPPALATTLIPETKYSNSNCALKILWYTNWWSFGDYTVCHWLGAKLDIICCMQNCLWSEKLEKKKLWPSDMMRTQWSRIQTKTTKNILGYTLHDLYRINIRTALITFKYSLTRLLSRLVWIPFSFAASSTLACPTKSGMKPNACNKINNWVKTGYEHYLNNIHELLRRVCYRLLGCQHTTDEDQWLQ